MCFFSSVKKAFFEKNEPFSTLKTVILRKYSSQKETKFSMGSKALYFPASNSDGFLSRETCVLRDS
jgi:hypothetical protein